MSRFVEILNRFHGQFNLKTFHLILEEMKVRLEAEAAHLEIEFPYFLTTGHSDQAPGMARYDCRLYGSLAKTFDLVVEVDIPVGLPALTDASLGTKSFSGIWGGVTVAVRMRRFLWIEDLIDLIEQSAVLQSITAETVESMCRRVSASLHANDSFRWYKVVVKNITSGYSTFASSEWPDPAPNRADGLVEACFSRGVPGIDVVFSA